MKGVIAGKSLPKASLFGLSIDNLSLDEAVSKILCRLKDNAGCFACLPNAQHIVLLNRDPEFKKAYLSADLILADGMPLVFLSRLLGMALKERIAGYDLLLGLFKAARKNNYSFFLLKGSSQKELEEDVSRVRLKNPGMSIAGYAAVPFDFNPDRDIQENEDVVKKISQAKPDILLVALGAPKQEKWIWANKERLASAGICLAIGGAVGLITGRLKVPPVWIRSSGMEWLYRFLEEPNRLWRRYTIDNMFFLYLAFKEILRFFYARVGL